MNTKQQLTADAATSISNYLAKIHCENDGHMMEHFSNLIDLSKINGESYDTTCYRFTDTLNELLSLLTNPKISSLLPEHVQESVGTQLNSLRNFFENVTDGATTAAYDLSNLSSLDETELEMIDESYQRKANGKKVGALMNVE